MTTSTLTVFDRLEQARLDAETAQYAHQWCVSEPTSERVRDAILKAAWLLMPLPTSEDERAAIAMVLRQQPAVFQVSPAKWNVKPLADLLELLTRWAA